MLLNSFYTIDDLYVDASTINATLTINRSHAILEGHFPGQPVVPGVVMMQIIRELIEKKSAKKWRIVAADQLKFLSIIDPMKNNRVKAIVNYKVHEDQKLVTASLEGEGVTYFKMKATLTPAPHAS